MNPREVIEPLAELRRGAGSEGEARAARMLAEMFEAAGVDAQIDEEWFRDGYARLLMPLGAAGLLAALIAPRHRGLATALGAAATAALVDDVENGKRFYRRAVRRPQRTQNVVATVGDPGADRTLAIIAHHDAAPTGFMFDPTLQRKIAAKYPQLIERTDTGFPLWWPAASGPVLATLGAALGSRPLLRGSVVMGVLNLLAGADIARHRIVPGANDNLSGVAALVALASRLDDLEGLRVVLGSCGAEEVLQGGVYGFVDRHLKPLDQAKTWVLNIDTVGCPELIMLEGEGPFVMHEFDPEFRDLLAAVAERATGAPLRRGIRARASSDSIVPSRAGYRTAMLASWEPDTKLISNYHLPSDVPEHLHYETIERAVTVAEALARELATV